MLVIFFRIRISSARYSYLLFIKPLKGAVIIYDWNRGGRDMGVSLEKIQYPKRGFEKVFHSREGS